MDLAGSIASSTEISDRNWAQKFQYNSCALACQSMIELNIYFSFHPCNFSFHPCKFFCIDPKKDVLIYLYYLINICKKKNNSTYFEQKIAFLKCILSYI